MDLDVENVVLYVDDAVRYDVLTEQLPSLGPTYKTVAASTHTPTSFGSLLTGLLPPDSGILSFKHTIPDHVRSIFDVDTPEVTLAAEGGMNHALAEIFGNPPRATVEEVKPPFVHVVRRPGGHAPYDGFDWGSYEYRDETAVEYLWEVADDPDRARREYVDGVLRSFDEFRRALNVLERRGLAEDTLVVYTSDHGELLGEYGFFGHTHLATPEIVYVPTTFVHPSLDPEPKEGLLHHVDILPTITGALTDDVDVGRVDGIVLGRGRKIGYTHFEHVQYGNLPELLASVVDHLGGFERVVRSLWARDGGHVFHEGSLAAATAIYFYLLLRMPFGRQVVHNDKVVHTLRCFLARHQSYGSPGFGRKEAKSEIGELLSDLDDRQVRSLDDETREHLERMGYM